MPDNPYPPAGRMSDGEILARLDAMEARVGGRLDVIENKVTQTLAQATLTNGRVDKHDDRIEALEEDQVARKAVAARTAVIVGTLVGVLTSIASGLLLWVITGGAA